MKYTSIPDPSFRYEDFENYYTRVIDHYEYPFLDWLSNPDIVLSETILLMLFKKSDRLDYDYDIPNNPITLRFKRKYLGCPDKYDVPETDAQIRVLFFMDWAYHVRH